MFKAVQGTVFVALVLMLAACSGDKEVLTGKRISVLGSEAFVAQSDKILSKSVKISEPENVSVWSQFAGNVKHVMPNIKTNSDLKEKWRAGFGKGADDDNMLLARPVAANGVLYVQDTKATVVAFELATGKKIFKHKLKPVNESDYDCVLNGVGLAIKDDVLYAVAGFGSVFALNAKDGSQIWRKDFGIPLRTAPALSDKTLFIQTLNNAFYALDVKDGSELWMYNISAEDTVLAGSSVAAFDEKTDTVVTSFSNGETIGFNASIGYVVFEESLIDLNRFNTTTAINAVKASPVIDEGVVYVFGSGNKSMALKMPTGEVLWEGKTGSLETPWLNEDALFVLTSAHTLNAVDKKTGDVLWQRALLEEFDASERQEMYLTEPVLMNGELVVASSTGVVYFVDASTGEIKRQLNTDEKIAFAPIAVDGCVVFVTQDAEVIVYQ